ncbi:hypothetical protein AALA56_06945 [Streptococcus hyointestinalis]|uniref:hypothetical protein n=1 Tax=Streptococcus hyointestinalis TaxID=1337 RepID=UPI00351644E7
MQPFAAKVKAFLEKIFKIFTIVDGVLERGYISKASTIKDVDLLDSFVSVAKKIFTK